MLVDGVSRSFWLSSADARLVHAMPARRRDLHILAALLLDQCGILNPPDYRTLAPSAHVDSAETCGANREANVQLRPIISTPWGYRGASRATAEACNNHDERECWPKCRKCRSKQLALTCSQCLLKMLGEWECCLPADAGCLLWSRKPSWHWRFCPTL